MDYLINKLKFYIDNNDYAVISIDCKNKEKVGNFANNGVDYCLFPILVNDHDFCDIRVAPYGIYDIKRIFGFINLGTSKDTAEFSVNSIEKWWYTYGYKHYSKAKYIVITADSGGSNSSRSRLFKFKLQEFANKTGLTIIVHHYPPGKSKYNKIEHQLFCHISNNWRARPLKSLDEILKLIRATRTLKGLSVEASLDTNEYQTGIKITDSQFKTIQLLPDQTFGNWNYTIFPLSKKFEYDEITRKSA